jgi:SAM-dependent methyltransferase
MAFYDHIAKQWHAVTGFDGGPFRRFVLNALFINAIRDISDRAIIELGAGNGYFLPLLMRRYSGQQPARVVITDQSKRQLDLAKKHFAIEGAEYTELDVRNQFPFRTASFDLVIATMVFNEVSKQGVASAIAECRRVLRSSGQLLATVIHPDFVARLSRRGELRRERSVLLTMPSSSGLRLPVRKTATRFYKQCLKNSGFEFIAQGVSATRGVLNARPGLRKMGNVPQALVFDCRATST